MGYIGNQADANFSSIDKQVITGNGGTGYTLSHSVANANEIAVYVNNVRQDPGVAYTVSNAALTMTGAVANTDSFYVVFLGKAVQTKVPPDGSVSAAKLASGIAISASTGTFSGDLTVDTSTLKVDSSNNKVGIGTTSPAHNVEIVSTASGSVNDTLQIRNNATASGTGSRIRFINSTDANSDTNGASIASIRTGNDNDLAFETENAERMRIIADGKVGIGTTSPSDLVHLKGG